MRKFVLWASVSLTIIAAAMIVAVRHYIKVYVESDQFIARVNRGLNLALHSVTPHISVKAGSITLAGMTGIAVENIVLTHDSRKVQALAIDRIEVQPLLMSLLKDWQAVQFRISAYQLGTEIVSAGSTMPVWVMLSTDPTQIEGRLSIQGSLKAFPAPAIQELLHSELADPYFRLVSGTITGDFSFEKPFGTDASHGVKAGFIEATFSKASWMVGSDKNRIFETLPAPVSAKLQDFRITVQRPIILATGESAAEIKGVIMLPERRDLPLRWDLDVYIKGSPDLMVPVARLFRCESPPTGPNFRVEGPSDRTSCGKPAQM